jgi:hypothetical protein
VDENGKVRRLDSIDAYRVGLGRLTAMEVNTPPVP